LWMGRGTIRDFAELERFHYRKGRPATWAGIWVVRYFDRGRLFPGRPSSQPSPGGTGRAIAVAVLSYPCLNSAARDDALNLHHLPRDEKTAFLNTHLRALSRVIVHPQFRSIGLASRLARCVCHQCPTRWVEAHAAMGKVHPFFEKGGMQKHHRGPDHPVYYLFDRERTSDAQ
jgi:GNAT superfamily N-acetyltransferase